MTDERAVDEIEGPVDSASTIATRDWFAWNNLQPSGPSRFHVTGDVHVPNPGVDALLVPRVPPVLNPTILLLDVILKQAPGTWPQVFVWAPVRYDKVPGYFQHVQIFAGGKVIADVPAHDVH